MTNNQEQAETTASALERVEQLAAEAYPYKLSYDRGHMRDAFTAGYLARDTGSMSGTQVKAVLAIHRESYGCCAECGYPEGGVEYPCPTVRAIEEAGE